MEGEPSAQLLKGKGKRRLAPGCQAPLLVGRYLGCCDGEKRFSVSCVCFFGGWGGGECGFAELLFEQFLFWAEWRLSPSKHEVL